MVDVKEEDISEGLNDWRNIQDVVRKNFVSLFNVVKSQEQRIKSLETKLEDSARASDVKHLEVSLSNKPTFAEVNRITAEIVREFRNSTTIEQVREELQHKSDKKEVQELYSAITVINSRLESREHDISKRELEGKVQELQNKVNAHEQWRYEQKDSIVTKERLQDTLVNYQTLQDAGEVLKELVTKDELDEILRPFPTVEALDEILSSKVDIETMVQAFKDHDTVQNDVQQLVQAETEKLRSDVESKQAEMFHDLVKVMEGNTKDIQDSIANKVSRVEFLDVCGQKIGLGELETRLKTTTEAIASDVRESIQALQEQFVQVLNKKAFLRDVEKLLESKASKSELRKALARKAEVADVKEALALKLNSTDFEREWSRKGNVDDVENLQKQMERVLKLNRKLPHPQTDQQLSPASWENDEGSWNGPPSVDSSRKDANGRDIGGKSRRHEKPRNGYCRDEIRSLEEAIKTKASIEDVCTLVDQKASTVDVNEALKDVNRVLQEFEKQMTEDKTKVEEATKRKLEQIAKVVDKEISIARWIWNSGRIESERAVPWNVQTTNTKPGNFIWSKDQVDIVTNLPGLYEISLGFFTEKDPAVQVLVNGEPALSAMRATSTTVNQNRLIGAPSAHRSAGKTTVIRRGRHSCGNVTGWTLLDFVALPAKATITILYDGDPTAQGFMSMRKL